MVMDRYNLFVVYSSIIVECSVDISFFSKLTFLYDILKNIFMINMYIFLDIDTASYIVELPNRILGEISFFLY